MPLPLFLSMSYKVTRPLITHGDFLGLLQITAHCFLDVESLYFFTYFIFSLLYILRKMYFVLGIFGGWSLIILLNAHAWCSEDEGKNGTINKFADTFTEEIPLMSMGEK